MIVDCDSSLGPDYFGHCPGDRNTLNRENIVNEYYIDVDYFKVFSWLLITFAFADLFFGIFGSISKKYLEDYFRYALKIVLIEIWILLTLN